ncbi:MAG: hypothetical protein H7A52_03040 [Akkermansiaceae bacterium]|nr:hypothetical protein [Akkermansiaceae bacterium]
MTPRTGDGGCAPGVGGDPPDSGMGTVFGFSGAAAGASFLDAGVSLRAGGIGAGVRAGTGEWALGSTGAAPSFSGNRIVAVHTGQSTEVPKNDSSPETF